jgi:hypothetical protein
MSVVSVIIQVAWALISIPFTVILFVYAGRVADQAFPTMATPTPAIFVIIVLIGLCVVILFTLLLRFEVICCGQRYVGLAVIIASLIVQDLAIAFYGSFGSEAGRNDVLAKIKTYTDGHPGDELSEWVYKNYFDPKNENWFLDYVDDRTRVVARLLFGFGIAWFVIHTVAFYLYIIPLGRADASQNDTPTLTSRLDG